VRRAAKISLTRKYDSELCGARAAEFVTRARSGLVRFAQSRPYTHFRNIIYALRTLTHVTRPKLVGGSSITHKCTLHHHPSPQVACATGNSSPRKYIAKEGFSKFQSILFLSHSWLR
jgi:hypothetical protein